MASVQDASATPWTSLGGSLTGNISCVARSGTKIDCFARGTDNALWQRSESGTTWSNWANLGGGITTSPKCVSRVADFIDCYALNASNHLVQRTWNGTAWGAWSDLGGVFNSVPECVSWGANRMDCFVRGNDNTLRHRDWTYTNNVVTSVGPWQNLGSTLTGSISCAAWTNNIHCMTEGLKAHISGNGTTWNAWDTQPPSIAKPKCTSRGAGYLDCFDGNQALGLWRWNGAGWYPQIVVMNSIISGPSCIYLAGARTDCFGVGVNNNLYHRTQTGGSNGPWGMYENLGGVTFSDPECVAVTPARIDCFVRGQDNAMYQIGWNP